MAEDPRPDVPPKFADFVQKNQPLSPWTRFRNSLPDANLSNYIKALHDHVSNNPEGPLRRSPAEGPARRPDNNYTLPAVLHPWSGFMEGQKAALDKLHSAFPSDVRDFPKEHMVYCLTQHPPELPVHDIDVYDKQWVGVIRPVEFIIQRLADVNLDGIHAEVEIFNHPVKANGSGAVIQTDGLLYCIPKMILTTYNDTTVEDALAWGKGYLTVYRSPLKAPVSLLRQGLRGMAGPAGDSGPNDAEAAREVAAAAIGQVYCAMVLSGLEFGSFVTGDAYLFLRIDWNEDPDVLYYHLAEPHEDVKAHPEDPVPYMAVGQLLALTVRALGMG